MGRGRRRGQGEERLLRTIQTAGRQVSSIAHHHHQASALTFIQVWKVRSLTSRSFCRAPASSAQCGMGVGPSECCRGGERRSVTAYVVTAGSECTTHTQLAAQRLCDAAHPAAGTAPCQVRCQSRRSARPPGRHATAPGQQMPPPPPHPPHQLSKGARRAVARGSRQQELRQCTGAFP